VLVIAVGLHLAMMGSLVWGYLDPLFYSADRSVQGLDFFAFYEAGYAALENQSIFGLPYDTNSSVPYASPYRYVPAFAYLFGVPANALPPWTAYWAWVCCNELLLVLCAYLTWRVSQRRTWGLIGAAMWFLFTPFYLEQYMGQVSFLMAALVFVTAVGLEKNQQAATCVSWTLSLITKSATALATPVFLRLRWWPTLWVAIAAVAINLAYFALIPGTFERFLDQNLGILLSEPPYRHLQYWPGYQGATALIENTFLAGDLAATSSPAGLTTMFVAPVLALSLLATLATKRADALVLFCIWVAAFFLTYSTVWEFHYVMLQGPLILLAVLRPRLRLFAAAIYVLLAIPTPYWPLTELWANGSPEFVGGLDLMQDTWPTWGVLWFHAAKAVPVFALWVFLVLNQLRGGLTFVWTSPSLDPRPAQQAGIAVQEV
jgi:hypothetical protein